MKARQSVLWVMTLLLATTTHAYDFAGGTGEPNAPYQIATAQQLCAIGSDANLLDKHFVLVNDIDLDPNLPGGQVFDRAVIFRFQGCLDGHGYVIKNLVVDANRGHGGLFETIVPLGRVENLILEGIRIACHGYVGSMVGVNGGTISNCVSSAHIVGTGRYAGGLVGYNMNGRIIRSHSTGTVTGENSVGGLVGSNNGTIQDCSSDSEVSGISNVGGLAGENGVLYGDVVFRGTLTSCYASGPVLGVDRVAGLIGYNGQFGEVVHCYAAGPVSGQTRTGGLIGESYYGYIESCVWDIQSSGQPLSAAGSGKTTAQMQTRSTYAAWGCDHAWTLEDSVDYPRLTWQGFPGEPIVRPEFGGGSGTELDPYLIYTAHDLNQIGLSRCDWDKHFRLMDNLDMNDLGDEMFNPIGYLAGYRNPLNHPFTGVIDGNDYAISNLRITAESGNNIGFVPFMSAPGSLRHLTFTDPNIDACMSRQVGTLVGTLQGGLIAECHILGARIHGDREVGGLVGRMSANDDPCRIIDCHFQGTVTGSLSVGGLAGVAGGTLTLCSSNAEVMGEHYIGGLIGTNYSTQVSCCDSKGDVTGYHAVGGFAGSNYLEAGITDCNTSAYVQGTEHIGGFAGLNFGVMVNCMSRGHVSGENYVGALVASNSGKIEVCNATGSVTGYECVGGLVADNNGTISRCTATGNVLALGLAHGMAGGLVAKNSDKGIVHACYATGDVAGNEYVGGLIGYNRHAVSECYAVGRVSGLDPVGGLVGQNRGTVSSSFWNMETSGLSTSGGGTGLTSPEMQTAQPYLEAGWDFEFTWSICEGTDYPRLQWEQTSCDSTDQ
ncbi:MAG: hypothetical protein K9N55_20130 [Phycisphaerae bacterium]|nr:hypothetical protein [Phycisphaerae bacterium]